MLRSSPEEESVYLDVQSPLSALLTVRESGRTTIDAPTLGEWLTRITQADPAPGGGRWSEPGSVTSRDANTAILVRTFSWRAGNGVVQYGATSRDGKQGRVIRLVFGTRAAVDGPRGVLARNLFGELMQAELNAGAAAPAPKK